MASLESKLFAHLLRLIRKKNFLDLQFTFGRFDFYNSKEPPPEVSRICNVERSTLMGRNVFTLTPKGHKTERHVLYLHGGAYVQNFVRQHWKFLSMLAQRARCTITAPDYPLAPEHTSVDAFAQVTALYREILIRTMPEDLILMGDSAGGGFALALAQRLSHDNLPQPSKILLLSPWLDITLRNPEIRTIDPADPFLSASALRRAGRAYAGGTALDDYTLSPVNGPLENLGQISIFIGSADILVADARKLKERARALGIPVNYREYKDMVHVWMLLTFPESEEAKKEIIELIDGRGKKTDAIP